MSNRIDVSWPPPGAAPSPTKTIDRRLRGRLFAAFALVNIALWAAVAMLVWRALG